MVNFVDYLDEFLTSQMVNLLLHFQVNQIMYVLWFMYKLCRCNCGS